MKVNNMDLVQWCTNFSIKNPLYSSFKDNIWGADLSDIQLIK